MNEYYIIRDMIKDTEISQFTACGDIDDSFKHFLSIQNVINTAYSHNKITKLDRDDLIAIWQDKFHKIIDEVEL